MDGDVKNLRYVIENRDRVGLEFEYLRNIAKQHFEWKLGSQDMQNTDPKKYEQFMLENSLFRDMNEYLG